MVLMHNALTPPSQAPVLARAAERAVQNDAAPASNVIRVIMDGPVQIALRKHFGLAETPFMFAPPEGVVLDPEVEKLFSKCVKLNPIVTKATKGFPIARHMYELIRIRPSLSRSRCSGPIFSPRQGDGYRAPQRLSP
ncbi:hypothetical protein MVLG_07300 [Microbotryum lychnidis-dioicae p1A1 Lamole]|uniref:Uncharacterized protein n=1 Tax=Microbotryum lychnidis-dioicae (strain p1A1 Lamole / MvSl-1064) TaxID=683840 RepID=U5HJX5_USTV1|nr:hypothetical protein MVLG_07300 [Microbotryum lychnidis-dioicae p1A1 Lamole]|eukprot:KDE02126.1 hypothetical protein MVLG_07300 [Microbotryum lychnidis-dioicae p1A1 Lamole]